MRWFQTNPAPATAAVRQTPASNEYGRTTDRIRAALLDALDGAPSQGARNLMLRIHFAADPELLWYLRPAVMCELAAMRGEAQAHETLVRISPLFQDVLPEGLASKLRAADCAPHAARSTRRANLETA